MQQIVGYTVVTTKKRASKESFEKLPFVETVRYNIPVYNVPPCCYIVGTAILVVEVISVFPNIQAHNW
jgi:hypothetical protein